MASFDVLLSAALDEDLASFKRSIMQTAGQMGVNGETENIIRATIEVDLGAVLACVSAIRTIEQVPREEAEEAGG